MNFAKTMVTLAVAALAFAARVAHAAELPVGFAHASVPGDTALRGDTGNRLNIIIWYPAPVATAMQPVELGPPHAPYFLEGEGAQDAPLAKAPARMPFVVVSHGTGGSAMDLAWLCAGLAARGYIVAAVDHPGNNALEPPTVAGTSLYWLRAGDLSRVIDGVLVMPRFSSRIDRGRIGAAGESLGGYTVLEIAGARTDIRLLAPYCASKPSTPVCTGAASPGIPDLGAKAQALAVSDADYRAAVASNSESHRDSRVKAAFSIEPAQGPEILPESLAAIDIPISFVAGLGDEILPVSDNVIPAALAVRNASLTLFARPVGHYTFLIDCTVAGVQKFPAICSDAGPARVALHQATLKLALSFFARTIGVAR